MDGPPPPKKNVYVHIYYLPTLPILKFCVNIMQSPM